MPDEFYKINGQICKADDEMGLVFGWAIVCKDENGDYVDRQGDFIPQESMLRAAADFMKNSAAVASMHDASTIKKGLVRFCFPLTDEVAKAFNIECPIRGLMFAAEAPDDDILSKVKNGERPAFSIGGFRVAQEEIDA